MKTQNWSFPESARVIAREIFPELPPIIGELLYNRGLRSAEAAHNFLYPDYRRDIHDPFLFRDMRRVVERVRTAILQQEKIVVHGDYDADGICATAILTHVIKTLGGQVEGFIPHRELDGYGVRAETVEMLADRGTKLLITCDCGISNESEFALARGRGLEVIITDHHTVPPKIPTNVYAILHPKLPNETYPDKNLSGGGVAFKLMQGLLQDPETQKLLPVGTNIDGFQKWQLDLVAIASVADMVPLIGETRALVHFGCKVLAKTRRLGLQKLLARCGTAITGEFNPQTISFQIAPRLNAAGRMEHAQLAYDLLVTEDPERATFLADTLHNHNQDRQKLVEQIVREAHKNILLDQLQQLPALVVAGDNWPAGVLGLVAGKLKDEFYLPTFVIGKNDGRVVGSGRSVEEWNMIAAMQKHPELFEKFGGHPQACGFTLADEKNILPFATAMSAAVAADVKEIARLTPTLAIDAETALEEMDWATQELLARFAPFGVENPEPKFLSRAVNVVQATAMGTDNKHARILVRHNTAQLKKFVAFNRGAEVPNLPAGKQLDVVYAFGVNEWQGQRDLQFKIIDWK